MLAATTIAGLAALRPAAAAAQYHLAGADLYRIGETPVISRITYDGTESLTIARRGSGTRFVAEVECTRTDDEGSSTEHARFVQDLLPDGSFEDRSDQDPDFLTVLNQPFAVELDAATIRDLRELHASAPFAAASPLGGGNLTGELRPGIVGLLAGHRAVGVHFQANGDVSGKLPDSSSTSINGRIHLNGTAYYDAHGALLLALDATLTVEGTLVEDHFASIPVQIVYRRVIKVTP